MSRGTAAIRLLQLALLAASGAGVASGLFLAVRGQFTSPLLAFFFVAAGSFAFAAQRVPSDPLVARLLALSGALGLGAIGTLAGLGSDEVTLAAAGLGVLAGWAAHLVPLRRSVAIAFGVYIAAGLTLALPGLRFAPTPWALLAVPVWPLLYLLGGFAAAGVALVSACLIASVAIPGALIAGRRLPVPRLPTPVLVVVSLACGVLGIAFLVLRALAQMDTSARFELVPLALVVAFAASACVGFGVFALGAVPRRSLTVLALGAPVLVYALSAVPTVQCRPNSLATTAGPWWMTVSGLAQGGQSQVDALGNASGTIVRTDGHTIHFACDRGRVTEFSIE